MSKSHLTRDNLFLSRPKTGANESQFEPKCHTSPIDFTRLPPLVATYVDQSLSENTKRAYAADLAHFEAWGGCVPATDAMVACYLAEHAEALSVATLSRRVATISKAHSAKGLASPTASELVKSTIKGIKRGRGTAQIGAKPLLRHDLFAILDQTEDDNKGSRDRALLLIGFAGGFRRSELVGLDVADVEHVRQGIILTLRRSKTDQIGAGRKIAIPFGRTCWCPVAALDDWLCRSGIQNGPIFRPIDRYGHIHDKRLSGEAVALVLVDRLEMAGIDASKYSGHSLRAGFVTSAVRERASTAKIRAQTGHASDAMLLRYIRDEELFRENAAGLLL